MDWSWSPRTEAGATSKWGHLVGISSIPQPLVSIGLAVLATAAYFAVWLVSFTRLNTEIYVVDFPRAGSVMKWIATIPFPSEGQAFCWDPANPGVLYSVLKRTKEVIVGRVTQPR